jgi:hypothetical protein
MQSMFSVLSGAVLIVLVYGLSFIPSITLSRDDEKAMSSNDEDGMSRDAENAEASIESLRRPHHWRS